MDLPEDYEAEKQSFMESLTKTADEIREIEQNTIGQDNELWRDERSKRITSSNFGPICKMRPTTSGENTVKRMLYETQQQKNAILNAKPNQARAMKEFEEVTKLDVNPCGLFIDRNHCYLACSPRGLIGDDGIIKIVCPVSDMSPAEAISQNKLKYCELREEELYLNRNDNYYYQVQGQLHITDRERCYFVVWTPAGLLYEIIEKDDSFFSGGNLDKLKAFYDECLLPEIIDPRVTRGKPIRERSEYRPSEVKCEVLDCLLPDSYQGEA